MKVLIPDLPTADELLPFLRAIDDNRQYSNHGPLVRELESRLNGVLVSSATLGLEIMAQLLFRRSFGVRIPAFTFVATATAAVRAGLSPRICDVDRDTWALNNPDDNSINVSPFGAPVSGGRLIDAAGAWGNEVSGNRVYSLHATKCFPAGEGGLVCGDPDLLARIRAMANFGLREGMVSVPNGTNAKLSEYHAAVALASLERLPKIVARRQALEARYRQNLAGKVEMQRRPIGSYAIFPVLVPDRERVAKKLAEQGIETRSWYCPTLESHPMYANLPTDGPLKTAKMLSAQLLCLPFHTFLSDADVDEASDRLLSAMRYEYA